MGGNMNKLSSVFAIMLLLFVSINCRLGEPPSECVVPTIPQGCAVSDLNQDCVNLASTTCALNEFCHNCTRQWVQCYQACPINGGTGGGWGDPHLTTFDRINYDFQGAGEYILSRSTIDDFEVQARMEPWHNSMASIFSAIAMNVEGNIVGFYQGRSPVVYVDGSPVTIGATDYTLSGGGSISLALNSHIVSWPNAEQVIVTHHTGYLNVEIRIPSTRAGTVEGLLGTYDGLLDNEMISSNGINLGNNISFDDFYNVFGESWRVSDETSLFVYINGNTTDTFTNRQFPTAHVNTSLLPDSVYQAAKQTCLLAGFIEGVLLENCILDVGLTGNDNFAQLPSDVIEPLDYIAPTDNAWSLTNTVVLNRNSPPPTMSVSPITDGVELIYSAPTGGVGVGTSIRQFDFVAPAIIEGTFDFDVSISATIGTFQNTLELEVLHNGVVVKTLASTTANSLNANYPGQSLELKLGDTWGIRSTTGNFSQSTGTSATITITSAMLIPK